MLRSFLTANWRYLAMLNFAIDPQVLLPLAPPGTELDFQNGETFVSVVGFLFLDTRLLGLPIPRHRDFEEVNLRFYVRRKSADTWRRGVVFVREIVPKPAIAIVARLVYGERYLALPMKHDVVHRDGELKVSYSWRRGARWESLAMTGAGEPQEVVAGSHEDFIIDHSWGYTQWRTGCSEYRVEHPRWKIWQASSYELQADVSLLYGPQFAEALAAKPVSAFVAEGSGVRVWQRETNLAGDLLPAV